MPDDDLKVCPTCNGNRKYTNREGEEVECWQCVGTGWVAK